MLKIFAARVDHPLADPKEARRIIDALPGQEAITALESATAWLESLAAEAGFKTEQRLQLVLEIDETVLPHTRKLARDYLTTPRQTKAQEFRLWQANHGYWEALAKAYQDMLRAYREDAKVGESLRARLPLLCCRLLHAFGIELKWDQLRYGPIDTGLWQMTGEAYLEAVRGKVAGKGMSMYGSAAPTSAEAEYLKVLILQASSMDNLLPIEIEIAERVIAHLLPSFSLTDQIKPENVYWVDAAKPLPPTRLARIPEITPTLRFFSTGSALEALAAFRATVENKGALPADVDFGGQYSARVVVPVLDHLAACWSPKPPMRNHPRRAVDSRMIIVHGFAALHPRLSGGRGDPEEAETWAVHNVSQGGIGANLSVVGKDWLKVGVLIGMQPEGGDNWLVGVVRRFGRESEAKAGIGIETLSKAPTGIVADSSGLKTEAIALDPLEPGHDVRLVLSVAAWEEQLPLRIDAEAGALRLFPHTLVEMGSGYAIGAYRAETAA